MIRTAFLLAAMLFLGHFGAALAQVELHLGTPLPTGQGQLSATSSVADFQLNIASGPNPIAAFPILSQLAYPMPSNTRGAVGQKIYANLSPSVVLIMTDDGSGAGVVINTDGQILTNWHVIAGNEFVFVAFKPLVEGTLNLEPEFTIARIDKYDAVADLALLSAVSFPNILKPMPMGSNSEIQIGADTHAIGHPLGRYWTYTKGLISQIRRQFEWYTENGYYHKADVIQTQTPINPGNSGGPLISSQGNLIGINTFKEEGELLNFSISIDEIILFLKRRGNRMPLDTSPDDEKNECSEIVETSSGRIKSDRGDFIAYDTDCDGKPDMSLTIPDDEKYPFILDFDTSGDGLTGAYIIDVDRDKAWDFSFYDYSGNGDPDIIGCHSTGEIEPTSLHLYNDGDPLAVCEN